LKRESNRATRTVVGSLDRAAGPGGWTGRLDRAAGQGGWTGRLDRAAGQGGWTGRLDWAIDRSDAAARCGGGYRFARSSCE
jgi:hypothetical protein